MTAIITDLDIVFVVCVVAVALAEIISAIMTAVVVDIMVDIVPIARIGRTVVLTIAVDVAVEVVASVAMHLVGCDGTSVSINVLNGAIVAIVARSLVGGCGVAGETGVAGVQCRGKMWPLIG